MSEIEGSSPLNRLSWLRSSHSFLNAIAASPKARWLVLNNGQQLVSVPASRSSEKPAIAQLTTSQIAKFLGPEPYFGQGKDEGQLLAADEAIPFTESVRHRGVRIVFLGLLDTLNALNALPTSDFTDPERAVAKLDGIPYFALDIGELGVDSETFLEVDKDNQILSWGEARPLLMGLQLDKVSLSLFTAARSMVDWNQRNKFCPSCGSSTYSQWGGWKISCSTLLPWADNTGRKPCPTARGLHNFTHPRTDPVVIMVALDGEKILLGRGKKFPGKFYSALAGFIEPAETFEDAVVRLIPSQPFPANLMVGFYARADSSQPIRLDLDNELMDARWYTRAEVLEVLNHVLGTNIVASDHKKFAEAVDGKTGKEVVEAVPPVVDEPPFRVPPTSAIAGVLIREWAYGKIQFPAAQSVQKGHL
ncbi:NUDIX hydrolase domain-like protein [Mycena maculata]|uniref:NUDIX hydrolase domain-like protein n=1 Tax=Mycena maculata TaxID=230809 RepID=A0AAD7NR15_9AGAR|nr:NUDIX hydrolase domain-like protein [Mycena maculata]